MPPTVFVSSTIKDLADLRSAVRYFLEQYGFQVLTSESADFPHGLDNETRQAALEPIDDADYYVLLVGYRTGAMTEEGISVTRSEFRRARDLHRANGRPQLVLLARDEVLTASRKTESIGATEADNWPHSIDFLEEVHQAGNPADTNWVHAFRSFEEVATVLRTALRLKGPLRRLALEANLLEELTGNAELLVARIGDLVVPVARLLMPHVVPPPTDGDAYLDKHQTASIWVFRFALPAPNAVATVALTDAISSGEFLQFDPVSGRMSASVSQTAMLRLRERIARYETLMLLLSADPSARELATLTGHRSTDVVAVSSDLRTVLYAVRDEIDNVARLTKVLWRMLAGIDATPVIPTLNPPTPLAEEARRIEASSITRQEAIAWMSTQDPP